MDLLLKIKLSGRFGKVVYIISGILSVTMAALTVYRPASIPFCVIIKMFSIPVIHYLNITTKKGPGIYFYINLGISRKEYFLLPFTVEFISFVLLMTVSGMIGYAIR